MSHSQADVEAIAAKVRTALESADLDTFADLLDPDVRWGAGGDPSPPCRNRRQVLDWYRRGRAAGRRGHVSDVRVHNDKILVSMKVTSGDAGDGAPEAEDRWQVLTVVDGRVVEIRGYDDESEAVAAAGD
ncbi:MAG TPA: nuclear transport factor 2 family protein [Candidatus Dormibacteraeota bacterium]|nr:nuclear transport factor 2 family protein [Candidatus Dormibacteraeota bacterium]